MRTITAGGLLRVDALSMVFLLAVAFLYATTSMFAKGYLPLVTVPTHVDTVDAFTRDSTSFVGA